MTTHKLPDIWDAKKFALRYGLNFQSDFYVNGKGELVVFPDLPDNPPIFEEPDPVVIKPTVEEELASIKARLSTLEAQRIR
jgi:hypothetical protein